MYTCPRQYNALNATESTCHWQRDLVQTERTLAEEIPKIDADSQSLLEESNLAVE